ncbi:MAG: FAD-binding oxidoreductase [Chloroflexi bacterium]|nr:FAD-binding oxidoreductase [Chloroflexota bacterium]
MPEKTADVIVVGGGVMGCSTLYYLAQMGVTNTLLLERDTLGSGSTGRSAAILRSHYSNEVTTRMAIEGHRVISNFEDEIGEPGGFVKTGYFFLASEEQAEPLRRNVALGRSLGLNTEALEPAAALELLPDGFNLDGIAAIASEPDSGYADSSAVTNGFASAARRAGATIKLGVEVTGILTGKGRVTGVQTTDGPLHASAVVLVAGPWSAELLMSVGAPVPLSYVRHQVVQLRRSLQRYPTLPTVADAPGGYSFRPDSGDVTLVTIKEDPADRETYNRSVDAEVAQMALEVMAHRLPGFEEAGWDGGWSGLFTVTPDWHPVIDRVPGVEGLVCGVGFSGHGFKLSPAIGRALAELTVEGRSTSIDMTPLRFTRFAEDDLIESSYGATVFA